MQQSGTKIDLSITEEELQAEINKANDLIEMLQKQQNNIKKQIYEQQCAALQEIVNQKEEVPGALLWHRNLKSEGNWTQYFNEFYLMYGFIPSVFLNAKKIILPNYKCNKPLTTDEHATIPVSIDGLYIQMNQLRIENLMLQFKKRPCEKSSPCAAPLPVLHTHEDI